MHDFEDVNNSWTEQIEIRSRQAGEDILNRMFEPTPIMASYSIGDTVRLRRPELSGLVPVGAIGTIVDLDNPDGAMYAKGRPYEVEFELAQYKIPASSVFPPHVIEKLKAAGSPHDEYLRSTATYFGTNDLEVIGSPLGSWFYLQRNGQKYELVAFAPFPDDASNMDALARYIGKCVAEKLIEIAQDDNYVAFVTLQLDDTRLYWV
jgi:hypothetical protein